MTKADLARHFAGDTSIHRTELAALAAADDWTTKDPHGDAWDDLDYFQDLTAADKVKLSQSCITAEHKAAGQLFQGLSSWPRPPCVSLASWNAMYAAAKTEYGL